jgi:hypothetical protein
MAMSSTPLFLRPRLFGSEGAESGKVHRTRREREREREQHRKKPARGLTALTVPSRLTILLGDFSRGLAFTWSRAIILVVEPRFGKIAHANATRVASTPPHSTFCPPSWSSEVPPFLFQVTSQGKQYR